MKYLRLLKEERVRGYLYRVACAVGLALVSKEVITAGDLQVYELVASALFGLASVNTSVKKD